jgi:hypothetical protein
MFHDNRFAGSWPDLVARLDTAGTVRRWAAAEAALTGLTGIDDITGTLAKGADPDRADEVVGALVRLAAGDGGDDADAVLLLLHLLSDGVLALAGRMPGPPDLLPVIVAEPAARHQACPVARGRTPPSGQSRGTHRAPQLPGARPGDPRQRWDRGRRGSGPDRCPHVGGQDRSCTTE